MKLHLKRTISSFFLLSISWQATASETGQENACSSENLVECVQNVTDESRAALQHLSHSGKAIWLTPHPNNVYRGADESTAAKEAIELYRSEPGGTAIKKAMRVCFVGGTSSRVVVVAKGRDRISLYQFGCTDFASGTDVVEIVNRDNGYAYGTYEYVDPL